MPIKIPDTIVPLGSFPVAKAIHVFGASFSVGTISDLNSLPKFALVKGTVVYVKKTSTDSNACFVWNGADFDRRIVPKSELPRDVAYTTDLEDLKGLIRTAFSEARDYTDKAVSEIQSSGGGATTAQVKKEVQKAIDSLPTKVVLPVVDSQGRVIASSTGEILITLRSI